MDQDYEPDFSWLEVGVGQVFRHDSKGYDGPDTCPCGWWMTDG